MLRLRQELAWSLGRSTPSGGGAEGWDRASSGTDASRGRGEVSGKTVVLGRPASQRLARIQRPHGASSNPPLATCPSGRTLRGRSAPGRPAETLSHPSAFLDASIRSAAKAADGSDSSSDGLHRVPRASRRSVDGWRGRGGPQRLGLLGPCPSALLIHGSRSLESRTQPQQDKSMGRTLQRQDPSPRRRRTRQNTPVPVR
jgi:hypothetical protein